MIKTTIHRITYDPFGHVYCESNTPIVDPVHETAAEWIAARVARDRGWVVTSPNQVGRVDAVGYLDVCTYEQVEEGEE